MLRLLNSVCVSRCAALVGVLLAVVAAAAQQARMDGAQAHLATVSLRRAEPGGQPPVAGSIGGVVKDESDGLIPGAEVTLAAGDPARTETTQCDSGGTFFFETVPSGPYTLTVNSPGFKVWSDAGTLGRGESRSLPEIALAVLPVGTTVHVIASRGEVAAAQLHFEEQQRVLGVFPNFYASYIWDADPLSARQKFALAWRFSIDPVAFGMAGAVAADEQWQNAFPGYGRGFTGYAKRFGASYTDGFNSTMLGQAILPAILHQDPRYFVKGTGTVTARALYAMATAVICRGDNRRWQVNYSNILGNFGAAGLSNLYYPSSSRRGVNLTVETAGISTAMGAVGGLIQEFMLHRMTPHVPDYAGIGAGIGAGSGAGR